MRDGFIKAAAGTPRIKVADLLQPDAGGGGTGS